MTKSFDSEIILNLLISFARRLKQKRFQLLQLDVTDRLGMRNTRSHGVRRK